MPHWSRIDLPDSRAVQMAEERKRRLELYWTEFDTSEEAGDLPLLTNFMIRPMDSLTGEGDYAVDDLVLDLVGPSWRVVTTIHNHHRGLNPRITRFVATVSEEEETVYLDAHKQNE